MSPCCKKIRFFYNREISKTPVTPRIKAQADEKAQNTIVFAGMKPIHRV
jgi:hypothetical protein